MDKTQEALHKALKVLNCLNNDRVYETAWVKGAINACEEALEQTAQEPVAWLHEHKMKRGRNSLGFNKTDSLNHNNIPLYTHPAPSCKCEEWGMKYCECRERK